MTYREKRRQKKLLRRLGKEIKEAEGEIARQEITSSALEKMVNVLFTGKKKIAEQKKLAKDKKKVEELKGLLEISRATRDSLKGLK